MTNPRRGPPPPTFARIERAWRGQSIDAPDKPEGPPPPFASLMARRINWALAATMIGLCLFAAAGFVLPIRPDAIFGALGGASLDLALLGLRTHRIIGVTFRGRFIARREREPWLYWSSLGVFGLWGPIMLWLAWSDMAH
jgi:hypothetical protein